MGARADIFHVKNGNVTHAYSHWGATHINRIALRVAELDTLSDDEWDVRADYVALDYTFAEGGALVDHDTKVIIWFGDYHDLMNIEVTKASGWSVIRVCCWVEWRKMLRQRYPVIRWDEKDDAVDQGIIHFNDL